jgi:hypothetical protein
VETFKCSPDVDFSHCAMDSSILILGEMTGGILLACVPIFGPLFFPDRKIKSLDRNQHVEDSLETIASKPTKRKKTLGGRLADSLFSSKTDTGCQEEVLEDALPMRGANMSFQHHHTMDRASSE